MVPDTDNNRAAIIEIKRGRSQRSLPGNVVKAIYQIRRNRYAAPLLKRGGFESLSLEHGFFQKDLREQGRRGFVAVLNRVHADDTGMHEKRTRIWPTTLITTLRNCLALFVTFCVQSKTSLIMGR